MSATSLKVKRSTVSTSNVGQQMDVGMLVSVIFLLMALLQVISFTSFKDWLSAVGFSGPAGWAAVILIVEIVAAVGFLRLALPPMAKVVAWACAVLGAGFWFVENLRLVSDTTGTQLSSSGYFGKYLQQTPSWWTVIEASLFLFLTISALGYLKEK